MKICTKCKEEKPLSEFPQAKSKDGRRPNCKVCHTAQSTAWYKKNKAIITAKKKAHYRANAGELKAKAKAYRLADPERVAAQSKACREKNRTVINARNKEYYNKNREKIRTKGKAYAEENKNKISARGRAYYKENKGLLAAKSAEYRRKNKEKLAEKYKAYMGGRASANRWLARMPPSDGPEDAGGFVSALCKTCGKSFFPTMGAVIERVKCFEGVIGGDKNLYCSVTCKDTCPVYNFTTTKQVDPRSKLYVPPSTVARTRQCKTSHLRQLQCDKKGHTYCEKCGDICDVELHHTLEVAKHGEQAINSAGHMLLCAGCHMELHHDC